MAEIQSNKYPDHYFFILQENQGFIYNKSKGNTSPESIKFQSITKNDFALKETPFLQSYNAAIST